MKRTTKVMPFLVSQLSLLHAPLALWRQAQTWLPPRQR